MTEGCTAAQGYYIGRPLPKDAVAGFLADHDVAAPPPPAPHDRTAHSRRVTP